MKTSWPAKGSRSRAVNVQQSEGGSTLLVTMITCVLVGTVLCSYLVLITHRNTSAMRAMAWNTAIPVLEAGIEEALTHLHNDSNSPTANNWQNDTVDGQPVYWKRRDFPDGSYFMVTNVNIYSPAPKILSAGYVPSPLRTNEYISRLVEVTATNPPSAFNYAIAANNPVKLSGNAVVDGFNSSGFPDAMTAYATATNRNANGGIATNSRQTPAISVGTAYVFGRAVTGPGGTVATAGGAVGDADWNANHTGLDPEYFEDNMNVDFQDNSAPQGAFASVTATPGGGSNITYLTYSSSTYIYKTDSLVSNDKTKPVIVTGNATLWVQNNLSVSGSGYIYIAPGASLTLYVGGTASISGGGIVNATGLPQNFTYLGLPSNKVLNYSGAANFIGTINAPRADFAISGGSSVYGAVICNSFSSTGGSSVHYDQSVRGGGIFLITSWVEK